jgi:hypothetical protein
MLMPEPYAGEHDGYLAITQTGRKKIRDRPRGCGRRKDGSAFPTTRWRRGRVEGEGEPIFVGIIRDHRAQGGRAAQREAEMRLRSILDRADAVVVIDQRDHPSFSWPRSVFRLR